MLDFIHPMPSRIERGRYVAEVLQGGSKEPFWYYLIRRKDSNEIIDLVKFESYEQAMEMAQKALARLNLANATG